MKKIAIYIMIFGLSIIYAFMKLFPTKKNKVVFISRQSDEMTLDFKMIQDKLKKCERDAEIVTICHRLEGEKSKGLSGLLAFAWSTFRSMYHMATSTVCVLDAYWPAVSILHHKKSLTVIQIWHALGKIKQSGYQTIGKESGRGAEIARLMKMHQNYDYIIAGGKAWNLFYCKSFNVTEDRLLNYGLPRIDYLLETAETNRKKVMEAYPEFRKRKIILYAPTFRRNIELHWEGLIDAIDMEKYALVVKGHPNQKLPIHRDGVYECQEFKSTELLSSCEYLITDYSAIAIEGAVLNKKTFYFVYDYEEYREKNGMNIDLFETMPGCVFKDAHELIRTLDTESYNQEALDRYRTRFLPEDLGQSTEKISKLIASNMNKQKRK